MWLVKTIVCTSTRLMNDAIVRAQIAEKLDVNRLARLNVVQSLGKVIGIADAFDYGATIFTPVDTVQLLKSVEAAKQNAPKRPTGEPPALQDLDQPRVFEEGVQWKDQQGKAEGLCFVSGTVSRFCRPLCRGALVCLLISGTGWDVVLQMYDALARIGDRKTGAGGIDDRKFKQFAKCYQQNIQRLTLQAKKKYQMLRDELKLEEENLMKLLNAA